MANNIVLATKYLADPENLNGVFKLASLTADLEAARFSWDGGNSIKLPKNAFGSLGNYNRASGHPATDVNRQWSTYTLSQDKGNKIPVDAMDLDESLIEGGVVALANDFIRQVVVPDVDTYRFGRLKALAGTKKYHTNNSTDNTIDINTAREKIDAAFVELNDNEATGAKILYINPTAKSILERTFGGYIPLGTWNGVADNRVEVYKDAKVIEVPSGRLGANVNFILVALEATMGTVKHTAAKLWQPGEIPGYDGGQIDYRVYHDLFVHDTKTKGVYVSIAEEAA